MNLLKSPLRRTMAVLAGAVIGMTGVVALQSPASAHHPAIEVHTDCPTGDSWKIEWRVTAVAPGDREATITTVSQTNKDHSALQLADAGKLKTLVAGGKIGANQTVTETQTVPKSVKFVRLELELSWLNGEIKAPAKKSISIRPNCKPDEPQEPEEPENPPSTPPTTPAQPGEPTPVVDMDCTTIEIGLDNPKDGTDITLKLETSKGEKRDLTVKPGEKKTEKFSATKGFTVKVGAAGTEDTTTIAYEQPEDCSATGSGGGGELALTGANAGTVAGVAGGVLLLGAALFFMARRRKVKFTA